MKRVAVTGASGFIGRHVLAPLHQRGYEIHALGRSRSEVGGVQSLTVDLHDPEAVAAALDAIRPTHLLHLAWYTEPGKFWRAPENLTWVASSLHLLRAFIAAGGTRAVMAGSCAEYDWSGDCCDPAGTALRPSTLYGECKLALSRIAESYCAQEQRGFAWGRVFFLYGPDEKRGRLVADVAAGLTAGEAVPCTEGSQVRDFLHVADVAAAFAALVDSPATGTLDVGSGEGVTIREVVTTMGRLAGRPELVKVGALPPRPNEPARIVADPSRLRAETDWRPRYSLEQGLGEVLQSVSAGT